MSSSSVPAALEAPPPPREFTKLLTLPGVKHLLFKEVVLYQALVTERELAGALVTCGFALDLLCTESFASLIVEDYMSSSRSRYRKTLADRLGDPVFRAELVARHGFFPLPSPTLAQPPLPPHTVPVDVVQEDAEIARAFAFRNSLCLGK